MLEKHESKRIFRIPVHGVEQTAGFETRPSYVFETDLEHSVDGVGTSPDTAGDEEHARDGNGRSLELAQESGASR